MSVGGGERGGEGVPGEKGERERQAVVEQERLRRLARERELQLQAKREIEQFRERVSSMTWCKCRYSGHFSIVLPYY